MLETLPPFDTIKLSEAKANTLRTYEGYWLLVREVKFIQIFLPVVSPEELKDLRIKFVRAIKKEKQKDLKGRYSGELSFSWFENIIFVRLS